MTEAEDSEACVIGQSLGTVFRMAHITCTSIYEDPVEPFILAHEVGHASFSLPDEYGPSWGIHGPFCGHSIMNGPNNSHIFCTGLGHCKDPGVNSSGVPYTPPPGPPSFNCTPSGAMWWRLDLAHQLPTTAYPDHTRTADPTKTLPDNTWANGAISVVKLP